MRSCGIESFEFRDDGGDRSARVASDSVGNRRIRYYESHVKICQVIVQSKWNTNTLCSEIGQLGKIVHSRNVDVHLIDLHWT